jgi:hypothetical protein
MHDGYLFTLGVCGSASGGPAQHCLDAMLAALPPVKRAAYLGEVLVSESAPSLRDPLVAPLLAEIADAELLLAATPLPGGLLPPRLRALAEAIIAAPPAGPRFAVLISFADNLVARTLDPLRAAFAACGATLIGELQFPADAPAAVWKGDATELARAAYARARSLHPEALQ